MSARIAEIKRLLRNYGVPIGRRVLSTLHTPDSKYRVSFYEACLSLTPNLIKDGLKNHNEGIIPVWVSLSYIGRYGDSWEDAWERLLKDIRTRLQDEIIQIEDERCARRD